MEKQRFLKRERLEILGAVILFFLLPVLCFPELFFRQNTLYQADITWIHYPLRVLAAGQWKSGQVPLWNPYVLSGFPLLAESQVGVLYPLNALFLLPLPPYRALTLFVTVHFTLAATFTYLLARFLGINWPGATLAGLGFGFGGFLMAQITNLNIMTGAAWLPLVFYGLAYALRCQRPWPAALGGLPLALQILTAQPQVVFVTIVFLGGYGLYKTGQTLLNAGLNRSSLNQTAKIWGLLSLMLGVGLLLAAPQWLPTWELQRLSVRSTGLSYQKMTEYSLPPVQWLTLALPGVFGNNVASSYQGVSGNFEETYVYVGILPLLLTLFSRQKRWPAEITFLWLAVLIGAMLAMGGYTPFYKLVSYLPGFNLFRVPARWLMIVSFGLALLAAWGLEAFLQHRPGEQTARRLVGLWLIISGGLLLLWIFRSPLLQWLDRFPDNDMVYSGRLFLQKTLFEPGHYNNRLLLSKIVWWQIPAVALVSRLGIAVALLTSYMTGHLSRSAFITVALSLTALDVSLAGGSGVNRVTDASHWQSLSASARYILETGPGSTDRLLSLAEGSEKNIVAGLGQYFPSVYHLHAASGHKSPLRLRQYETIMQLDNQLTALALTGTRFILTDEPFNLAPQTPLALIYQDGTWYVYENLNRLPRVFIAHQAVIVNNPQAALTILQKKEFNPFEKIILETTIPLPVLSASTTQDQVTILKDTPSLIEIETNSDSNGVLVLLDNDYPGWQVYVDGHRQPIIRANYFARAVYLEKGHHRVRFVFRPVSFQIGLGLSGMGILAMIILWFKERI